jgi:hypothetical protein
MGNTALNIRYKTYTAGIMLVFFPIQTLGTLVSPFLMFAHDGSLKKTIPMNIQKNGVLCNIRYKSQKKTAAEKEENGGGEKNMEEF